MKQRGYEHRIVDHKDSKISHSVKRFEKNKKNVGSTSARPTPQRRNQNNTTDYKELNNGKKIIINPGASEVAKHLQSQDHKTEDIQYSIVGNEENWRRRGIREAIEIRRRKPTLNADDGRFHLSAIWNKTIKPLTSNNYLTSMEDQSKKLLQRALHSDSNVN